MNPRQSRQRVYDHRLRELVRRTGDIAIATALGVPRSTAAGWVCGVEQSVVTLDVLEMTQADLQAEVVKLRHRVQTLSGVVGLLLAVLRVSGCFLDRVYISDPTARKDLLNAVERARRHLHMSAILRVLRISASRYNLWVRATRGCGIKDRAICPKYSPNQLTEEKVLPIGQMVTAERYRHVPTSRLAVLAQRQRRVVASA